MIVFSNQPTVTSCLNLPSLFLNQFFSLVYAAHRLWRWQLYGKQAYLYFQRPILIIADVTAHQIVEKQASLQLAAIILEVANCAWQAEAQRSQLIQCWRELRYQCKRWYHLPYNPGRLHSPYNPRYTVWPKIKLVTRLAFFVLWHSCQLSMYLIETTKLLNEPYKEQRPKWRVISNLYQLYAPIRNQINRLVLEHRLTPLPIFNYLGMQVCHLNHALQQIEALATVMAPSLLS